MKIPSSGQLADTLEEAADLIETKGWVRGTYKSDDGFCAVGALCEVQRQGNENGYFWATYLMAQHLRNSPTSKFGMFTDEMQSETVVVTWNDVHASGEEVVDLMKTLAKDLRNTYGETEPIAA